MPADLPPPPRAADLTPLDRRRGRARRGRLALDISAAGAGLSVALLLASDAAAALLVAFAAWFAALVAIDAALPVED